MRNLADDNLFDGLRVKLHSGHLKMQHKIYDERTFTYLYYKVMNTPNPIPGLMKAITEGD